MNYTRNWTPKLAANLQPLLAEAAQPDRPAWTWLEIGVFEARSAVWVLEHLLIRPDDRYVGMDPWELAPMSPRKFPRNAVGEERIRQVEATARAVLEPYAAKTHLLKGRSCDLLRDPVLWRYEGQVRVAYVDGVHLPLGVLADMVLTWPLLAIGGLMVVDDYRTRRRAKADAMQQAIDQFVAAVGTAGEVVFKNNQLGLRKLADGFREFE